MNLNSLVKAAIFSSTAIGLGFAFMFIPNLEFISVTVFLSGLTLGGYIGAMVGGTSMLVYSGLNPLGSGLIHLPLFISQILAMSIVGILGGLGKITLFNLKRKYLVPISGVFGFFCTLWYNGITTLSYPLSAGFSFDEALAYSISGILFTLMHLISNTLIFTVVVPGYIYRFTN